MLEEQENKLSFTARENAPIHISKNRSTYTIVSLISYLIGVPKRIFDNEAEPPKKEIYERLEHNTNAKIIRNLCLLRTTIERHFKSINEQMSWDFKTLYMVDEIPTEILTWLDDEGIRIVNSKNNLAKHIIEINGHILNRINNCKSLFPIWINWDYVRAIFIMPNGLTEEGTKAAASVYYANRNLYPYQVYMNWKPSDQGNIFYNDQKFVNLLYGWNGDQFTDYSKVSDAGSFTKGGIYEFLNGSDRTVVVVDCENSDPYKLCATLKNLDPGELKKIKKIILYDDVHTATAWRFLDTYIKEIEVEHNLIERVKQSKSLVDIQLTAGACREFYQNRVDSFIIVSSDSDYWGLISSLPDARFLVMVEHEKCGPDMKAALVSSGIFYCYIDDFYSGDSHIRANALIREIYRYLDQAIQLNVYEMLDVALQSTRITMSEAERDQFYKKYIRPMHLVIEEDGDVSIVLREK